MDRLTLITNKGASITDRSNGSLAVLDIEDSHSVTVQGFTINGGGTGVLCNTTSVCYLTGNTIQDGAGTGVGVFADSHAVLESNVIQNNGFRGATVNDRSRMASSNDVFQGNGAQGVAVISGAYFGASNSSFLNNLVGVEAFLNSTVRQRRYDQWKRLRLVNALLRGWRGTPRRRTSIVWRYDNNRQWRERYTPGRRFFRGFLRDYCNG
jgi:hypothetical protein